MGFTREELEAARDSAVPDLVDDRVRLLFVGINPGLWTAVSGAHFAHPGNRFYKALHAAGVTDTALDVTDGYDEASRAALLERGIGITNLVNRATARADELDTEELRSGAAQVKDTVRRFQPRVVAFVGITAYRVAFHQRDAGVGKQDEDLAGAERWVLPNPSGLNAHYQLDSLARLFREVAEAAGIPTHPGEAAGSATG